MLNGDATRVILEDTDVPGDITVWADVLYEGPCPGGLTQAEWRRVRERHHAPGGEDGEDGEGEGKNVGLLRDWNERLDRFDDYEEVVFWLEHDLFDQLLLIRHLHWLSSAVADRSRARLICIDRFPGRERFNGLGELTPPELATLFPRRAPVSGEQIALGITLWDAFGSDDPRPLSDLVLHGDTSALPFAAGALTRYLEDFPSTANGLGRSEQQALSLVARGIRSADDLFRSAAALEERVFMGDSTFFEILQRLAGGRSPLLAHDGRFSPHAPPTGAFTLTADGRAVLEGRADYIDLNGIDRWMGGVHLTDGRYRWTGNGFRNP